MRNIFLILSAVLLSACGGAKMNCEHCIGKGGVIQGTNTAVVEVRLDSSGMPQVVTDPVIVNAGQRIVWVGPTKMTIAFAKNDYLKVERLSTRNAVINLELPVDDSKTGKTEIKYDIIVGDQVLDPIIIIIHPH